MTQNTTENKIKGFALQNAVEHNGKTTDKIVLAKILGAQPELRAQVKEIAKQITPIVKQINDLTIQEQQLQLTRDFADIIITIAQKQKASLQTQQTLPPLTDAQKNQVITRFPPEPNGYPHIGHAKAALINSEYVDIYGGKKILRLDDTNPENERMEYYAAIKVGLDWLGIKYDTIKNTSDDIDLLYQKGLELIESGKAYVCTCKREDIKKNREDMKSCKCSTTSNINDGDGTSTPDPKIQQKTFEKWHKMFEKFKPGEAILRFRGDMKSKNTVMRDPILFRIIDAAHPLLANKYRVWPSYDFAVAIEDSIQGVTHAFRSKEYELRDELYYTILDTLNMRKPKIISFSRLTFKGMPVSKRVLKSLIEQREVAWYDDPRLPTLEAMRKRGIKPQAIKKFILSLGFTKADTQAPFDALEAFNRKIIDGQSIRLNMIKDPKQITIANLPTTTIEIQNHPTNPDMGTRSIQIPNNTIAIEQTDAKNLKTNDVIRLMGLGNIRIMNQMRTPSTSSAATNNNSIQGEYLDDTMNPKYPKMQWIPYDITGATNTTQKKIKILIPKQLFIDDQYNKDSLQLIEVYTEPHYLQLKDDTPIQFIKFGYCRKDSQTQAIYTHK